MSHPPVTLAILGMPGVQLLDACGPLDVFAEANRQAGYEAYRLLLLACEPGPLVSSSGTRLLPDAWIGEEIDAIDTLLIAGTPQAADQYLRSGILDWLRQRAPLCRRFGSVCTGAFALAAAGLLDGRRVTTHWAVAQPLSERYPQVTVEADAIQVHDGNLRTAAGVTAGLDLALTLVQEDLGDEIAKDVAGHLVMYFKRTGGQMQFSRQGSTSPTGRSALQALQRYVTANPALDHGVANLAERMGISPRHFARIFQNDVGMTPAAWVEQMRVNAARERLEAGNDAPKQVAAMCGFANADTLRRAFVRHMGVTPAEYRKRYARPC
ncbi:GlxA family transcriptional regulator [Pseudomonas sp. TE21394]